jgi:hypothetical protein
LPRIANSLNSVRNPDIGSSMNNQGVACEMTLARAAKTRKRGRAHSPQVPGYWPIDLAV